jgi:Family of unknown function (DUF6159)
LRRHLSDGWRLGGAALGFLFESRPMQRFLLVSMTIVLVIAAGVAEAAVALRNATGAVGYVVSGLGAYYCLSLMTTATAVGLTGLVAETLDNHQVTSSAGWQVIRKRRRPIAGWAVVDLAVGVPSRLVGSTTVNQLSALLLGFGWGLLSFFAIPTIALVGSSPWQTARHSLKLVHDHWGDAVYGTVYLWVRAGVVFGLPGLVGVGSGVLLIRHGRVAVGGALFAAGIASLALGYVVAQAARAVITIVLYRYVESKVVYPAFPAELLDRSVRPPSGILRRLAGKVEGERLRRWRRRALGHLEEQG